MSLAPRMAGIDKEAQGLETMYLPRRASATQHQEDIVSVRIRLYVNVNVHASEVLRSKTPAIEKIECLASNEHDPSSALRVQPPLLHPGPDGKDLATGTTGTSVADHRRGLRKRTPPKTATPRLRAPRAQPDGDPEHVWMSKNRALAWPPGSNRLIPAADAAHPRRHGPTLPIGLVAGIVTRHHRSASCATKSVTPTVTDSESDLPAGGSTRTTTEMIPCADAESATKTPMCQPTTTGQGEIRAMRELVVSVDGLPTTAGHAHRLDRVASRTEGIAAMSCRAKQRLTANSRPLALEDKTVRHNSAVCAEADGKRCDPVRGQIEALQRPPLATQPPHLATVATSARPARRTTLAAAQSRLSLLRRSKQRHRSPHVLSPARHTKASTKWVRARTVKCSRRAPSERVRLSL